MYSLPTENTTTNALFSISVYAPTSSTSQITFSYKQNKYVKSESFYSIVTCRYYKCLMIYGLTDFWNCELDDVDFFSESTYFFSENTSWCIDDTLLVSSSINLFDSLVELLDILELRMALLLENFSKG